jgi:anti-sigma B factor antagonist
MKIEHEGETLSVSDIRDLDAANSNTFRDRIRAALPPDLKAIEIDLSLTVFVDSCGLGALIAVHKTACSHNGGIPIRLLNPTPPVQQIFELTRMHRLFEIVKRPVL